MDIGTTSQLHDAVLASFHVLELMAEHDGAHLVGQRTEQLALWKLLDVIGDSVGELGRLDPTFMAENPELGAVADLRERIAPEYDRPDFPLMYHVARTEILALHEHLVSLVPANPSMDGKLTT